MKPLVLLKQAAINSLSLLWANKEKFNHYKGVVNRLESSGLSGKEKKALAFKELETLGMDVLSWVGEFLFMLAVAYVKTEASKKL